jgi:hypothetical protein
MSLQCLAAFCQNARSAQLHFCHRTCCSLTLPCPESCPPQISSGVAASSVGACAAGAAADCAAPSALLDVEAVTAVPAASFAAFAFLLRGPGGCDHATGCCESESIAKSVRSPAARA